MRRAVLLQAIHLDYLHGRSEYHLLGLGPDGTKIQSIIINHPLQGVKWHLPAYMR